MDYCLKDRGSSVTLNTLTMRKEGSVVKKAISQGSFYFDLSNNVKEKHDSFIFIRRIHWLKSR